MKKTDLQNLPHCSYSEGDFIRLYTEDGWFLVKSTDKIENFYAFSEAFLPIKEEYPEYKVITLEEKKIGEESRKKANELKLKNNYELRKLQTIL